MMWNKDVLALGEAIAKDVPDWTSLHPDIQASILHWILEDRKTPKAKQAGRIKK